MSDPQSHNPHHSNTTGPRSWQALCADLVSILQVLENCVPARHVNVESESKPNSSVFPHILRKRTSNSTPDKTFNRFIQGLADICAYEARCDVFANAITASIPPTPKSGPGSSRVYLESKSSSSAIDLAQAGRAGPVVGSDGSHIHHVYFSSNDGFESQLYESRMNTYVDHCLKLLNTLHHKYVTDIGVQHPNSAFRDFEERMKVPVIAAFEREIALFVYTQCFGKVIHRIKKKNRVFYVMDHIWNFQQSQESHEADPESEGLDASLMNALWSIIPKLGLFVQLCDPPSAYLIRQEIWDQMPHSVEDIGGDSEQGSPESTHNAEFEIPGRPEDWIIKPFRDITLPSDDQLFFLYQSGLEFSKVASDARIKDWLEAPTVTVDKGNTDVKRVLEKAGTLSQAVENIVRYALRHANGGHGSIPGIPWTLTYEFLPPIQPDVSSVLKNMDGEGLTKLYRKYNLKLPAEQESMVRGWGETFRLDRIEDRAHSLKVHAEVNVIVNLIRNRKDKQVYPFVGCTKLSCYPCDMYFKALRDVDHYKFHTQGGHEKIYGHQWYPAPLEPTRPQDTIPALEHMIRGVLVDILSTENTYQVFGLSDSTGASGGSGSDSEW